MMFLKLHKEGEPLRVNSNHVEAYLSRPAGPGPGSMTMATEVGLRAGAARIRVDETPDEIDEIINRAAGRPGVWSLDRVRKPVRWSAVGWGDGGDDRGYDWHLFRGDRTLCEGPHEPDPFCEVDGLPLDHESHGCSACWSTAARLGLSAPPIPEEGGAGPGER